MKNFELIIFDVDGTLVRTKSGKEFRADAADWELLPGRVEKLAALKAQGIRLALASNQGGVGFGLLKQEEIMREIHATAKTLGIPRGGVYICYNHPRAKLEQYRADDHRRKPGPGMLLEAMQDFEASPMETLMVGDRPEDKEAARAATCVFIHADDFFA